MHYDYDVTGTQAAGFYDLTYHFGERIRLIHSLRLEYVGYNYDNNALVGNTRDDGTPCSFGGCLYSRPDDRTDNFTNVGARIGFEHEVGANMIYVVVSNGFRPPQATELYRLRGDQTVADLDSEQLTAIELGLKRDNWSIALFAEETDNLILRDADGFNVSDGETESIGVEFEGAWQVNHHQFGVSASYARHLYGFDRNIGGFEVIEDGNEVDTAPRLLATLRYGSAITRNINQELEATLVGPHFINASNTAEYDGHVQVNWRAQWQVTEQFNVFARLVNVLNDEFADRADFAFGGFRYFPALPRQLYLGVRYQLR